MSNRRQRQQVAGYVNPAAVVAIAIAVIGLSVLFSTPRPPARLATPAPGNVAYTPFVFVDRVTGCEYLSTHTAAGLAPRVAADGATHMGCKGVGR